MLHGFRPSTTREAPRAAITLGVADGQGGRRTSFLAFDAIAPARLRARYAFTFGRR